MKIGVSACLLGHNVRYNGGNKKNEKILELIKGHEVLVICPEVSSGLPIPHDPIEIYQGRVISSKGKDYTDMIEKGTKKAFEKAKDCELVILKAKSPTCGHHQIYDGTFSDTLIEGNGTFTQLCIDHHIPVYSENDVEELKSILKE